MVFFDEFEDPRWASHLSQEKPAIKIIISKESQPPHVI